MAYTIIWLILCIVLIIAELSTLQLVSLWFAGGAFNAFIASFFLPFKWQVTVFAVSSLVIFLCTIPLLKNLRNKKHIPTNFDIDIGKEAFIIEKIDRKNNTGRANLNGVNWIAVCENEDDVIEKGERVIIKEIKGATLIVARK